MAKIEEIDRIVQKVYRAIWQDWYQGQAALAPAAVTVDVMSTCDGYSRVQNRIIISMGDGNLDDADILDTIGWPVWKRGLVHEMLHEYESKILTGPSDAGRALYQAHPHPIWGPGHEELFYTAICDRAAYFSMKPTELMSRI